MTSPSKLMNFFYNVLSKLLSKWDTLPPVQPGSGTPPPPTQKLHAPTFTPNASANADVNVTIETVDTGAHLFYTLGNPPVNPTHTGDTATGTTTKIPSNSGIVNSGDNISQIKSLAYQSGFLDSDVSTSGTYGQPPPPPPTQRPYLYGVGALSTSNSTEHTDIQHPSSGGGWAAMSSYTWTSPNIRFIRARYLWNFLEPSEGTFNWQGIDDLLARCVTYNKIASISLSAGTNTPDWVYNSGAIRYITHDPGAQQDAVFTDGVTNLTTTLVSATAKFDSVSDVGLTILSTSYPSGTTILSVTNATTAILSQGATTSGSGKTFTIKKRCGHQPLPWDTQYKTKWFAFLDAFAARYSTNAYINNIIVCGFMQEAGMYFGDSVDYGISPPPGWVTMASYLIGSGWDYSQVGVGEAYLAGAKAVIAHTMSTLQAQNVVVTYVRPFAGNITPKSGPELAQEVLTFLQGDDGAHPEYQGRGGSMVSSVFAVDNYGTPNRPITNGHSFPCGKQQFWWSSHTATPPVTPDKDVYQGGWQGPGSYPADPQPFTDMVGNAVHLNSLYMETYQADINNLLIQPILSTANTTFANNVPPQ